MAKGYWVVRVDIIDPEQYKIYQAAVGPFLDSVGGRFIVRGGRNTVTEGTSRQRTVVVEFDSYEAALSAYDTAQYEGLAELRSKAGEIDFVIVEGVDG